MKCVACMEFKISKTDSRVPRIQTTNTTVKMAFIPHNLQVTKNEVENQINNLGDNFADINLLVMVDYVYHHQENSYDGGLSMLDRINFKLGRNRPNPWNIQHMKDNIRNSLNPQQAFLDTINMMMPTVSDIVYYGL